MAIYIAGVIVLAVVVVIVSYLFTRAAVQKQNEAYMNDMRMKAQEMLNQSAAEGQILKHHVIYNRTTGSTTIEYYSTIPHEWIREELSKRS